MERRAMLDASGVRDRWAHKNMHVLGRQSCATAGCCSAGMRRAGLARIRFDEPILDFSTTRNTVSGLRYRSQ